MLGWAHQPNGHPPRGTHHDQAQRQAAGTELGQAVTFADADGQARTGQVWSQAPHRGTWWVVPTTRHVGEDSALLVHFDREGNGRTWASR